ncbi:MAG: putative toxin-antitoxin system toxin component, PIN family [Dehalococcoidia bacterium]|nr:putative toxin-antitoxin system toxin component, PIN family [Dehalococcoidia bacterium]
MIVVVDTNVFVSSLINSEGAPARILNLWRARVSQLAVCDEIIEELNRVVERPYVSKYLKSGRDVSQLLSDLSEAAIPFDTSLIQSASGDPDDDLFLALAAEAQADYIVSGDHHLLILNTYYDIPILTPVAFLARMDSDIH